MIKEYFKHIYCSTLLWMIAFMQIILYLWQRGFLSKTKSENLVSASGMIAFVFSYFFIDRVKDERIKKIFLFEGIVLFAIGICLFLRFKKMS